MNTLVIFELILVASAIASLFLMRRTYFPMNLFWAVGAASIGIAACLGAFVYSGFGGIKSYHSLVSAFAGSVGIGSFAIAALGGVFARQFHQAGWWIVLISVLGLAGVLLFNMWRMPDEVQYGVVGVLAACALYRLVTNAASGVFLLGGVVALVAGGLVSGWIASQFGVKELNIYHSLLSVSLISFGIFASKE
jgi:hypothetical protein